MSVTAGRRPFPLRLLILATAAASCVHGEGGPRVMTCGPCGTDAESPTGASRTCSERCGPRCWEPCTPTIASPALEAPDIDVALDVIPTCAADEAAAWDEAKTLTAGVRGQDDEDPIVWLFPAKKWGIDNWYPLDIYKHTLCGQLTDFKYFPGVPVLSPNEMDWNNKIVADQRFAFLWEAARPYRWSGFPGSWMKCPGAAGDAPCMEAEVTPGAPFRDTAWFPRAGRSCLVGRPICTYGPWVREWFHANRPEIHPAELTWWEMDPAQACPHALEPGTRAWGLVQVVDASRRYDRHRHFDLDSDEGGGWRPWASVPRQHSFFVAFDLDPGGDLVELAVRVQFSGNSLTRFRGGDEGAPGRSAHVLSIDNRVRAVVREDEAHDADVRVAFFRPCRRDGRILAWLRLTSVLDAGGFLGMEVVHRSTSGRDPASLRAAGLSECTRRPAVAMPLAIAALKPAPSGPQAPPRLRRVTVGGRLALVREGAPPPFGAAATETAGSTAGFVVLGGPEVSATAREGERLLIVPLVQVRQVESSPLPVPAAWKALGLAAAAPQSGAGSAPGRVVRARQWTLVARGLYAPARAGEVALEDETEASDALNEALSEADDGNRKALFGTSAPLRFRWSFEARRLPGGEPVPVVVGKRAPPGAVSVTMPVERGARSTRAVEFPDLSEDIVAELTASVQVTDPFGTTGTYALRIWNTVLDTRPLSAAGEGRAAPDPVGQLLRSAEQLAGTPAQVTLQAADSARLTVQARDPVALYRQLAADQTRTRAKEVFARQALQDGVVTADELRSLVEAARPAKAER